METPKPKLPECGSTQNSKRRYIIGYLSKSAAGELVISNPSPVQFSSDPAELSTALISAIRTAQQGKKSGPKPRGSKQPHGESNSSFGELLDRVHFTSGKDPHSI